MKSILALPLTKVAAICMIKASIVYALLQPWMMGGVCGSVSNRFDETELEGLNGISLHDNLPVWSKAPCI